MPLLVFSDDHVYRKLGFVGRFLDYWLRGPEYRQHALRNYDLGIKQTIEHYEPLIAEAYERGKQEGHKVALPDD